MKTDLDLSADLVAVINQEENFIFESFNEDGALKLGDIARQLAVKASTPVTILVRLSGSPVFLSAMVGTSPANFYWATRKANLVELYGQSSYRLGLDGRISGTEVIEVAGLDKAKYASHGGGFPIRTKASGLVGSVTISGLPQRDDHILVTSAIAAFLGLEPNKYGLPN